MRIAGLVPLAALLCCVTALAQDQQASSMEYFAAPTANHSLSADSATDVVDRLQSGQFQVNRGDRFEMENLGAKPELALLATPDDNICYTMRMYVVAKDSKDSDATHLVRYTTCQPGGRYRLKTTEIRKLDTP